MEVDQNISNKQPFKNVSIQNHNGPAVASEHDFTCILEGWNLKMHLDSLSQTL